VNRWPTKELLGVLLSALCVALGIWIVNWAEAFAALKRVRIEWLLFGILVLCASFACYAMRWRALLGDQPLLRFHQAFGYLVIGYMANAVLPLRPGDFLRAVLVGSNHNTTVAAALSSIVLERLFDVATVIALGSLLAIGLELPAAVKIGLGTFSIVGILGGIAVVALSMRPRVLAALEERLGAKGAVRSLLRCLHPFADGLAVLHRARHVWSAMLWNALAWGSLVLFMTSMLVAFQISAPPVAAVLVVVAVSLGAAIPSSPGSIGVYHAIAVLVLSVWGVPTALALAFALVTHGIAIALHIGLGAASASAMGIRNVLRKAGLPAEATFPKP
jgi:uncharacterized protein (TIRG00374 family)